MQDKSEKARQDFYINKSWLNLSEHTKEHYFGLCVLCWFEKLIRGSDYTHHIQTLKDRFDLRLDKGNLIPLCDSCHKKVHKLMDKSEKDKIIIQKLLKQLINKFNQQFY